MEACRAGPAAWAKANLLPHEPSFKRGGYDAALKAAIYNFHKTKSAQSAQASLESKLKGFGDEQRKERARNGLDNYVLWCIGSGVIVADYKVGLSLGLGNGLILGGEFSRVDVNPAEDRYRALVLTNSAAMDPDELRWPLVQSYISKSSGRPVDRILVGTQNLFSFEIAEKAYSKAQIDAATSEADNISEEVAAALLDEI